MVCNYTLCVSCSRSGSESGSVNAAMLRVASEIGCRYLLSMQTTYLPATGRGQQFEAAGGGVEELPRQLARASNPS